MLLTGRSLSINFGMPVAVADLPAVAMRGAPGDVVAMGGGNPGIGYCENIPITIVVHRKDGGWPGFCPPCQWQCALDGSIVAPRRHQKLCLP